MSKDEKTLVYSTNLTGKRNLWAMDLSKKHSYPYQFSQKSESSGFIAFDPNGKYVLTSFDSEGDENHHIYVLPPEGGIPQPLITGDENEKYMFVYLSEDAERVYYVTSENNPNFLNTRVRHLASDKDELLMEGSDGMTQLVSVSEDEETPVYLRMFANTYNNLFIKYKNEEIYVTPDHETIHVSYDPVFTDNQTIYFPTDFESEYIYLAKYDIENRTFEKALELDGESVTDVKFDKSTNALYVVAEKGVEDKLYQYKLGTGKSIEIDKPFDIVSQLKVTKSGAIYILGLSSVKPSNIYRVTDNAGWEQLTDNRVLGVSEEEMVCLKLLIIHLLTVWQSSHCYSGQNLKMRMVILSYGRMSAHRQRSRSFSAECFRVC